MAHEIVNSPSSRNLANAPAVGSHFASENDTMAANTETQT
jgi:hypothetical protein